MVKSTKTSPSKTKKPVVKKTVAHSKTAPKKSVKKAVKKSGATSQKVDFYPNRMTLAISVLAGTLLVLISLITVLGVQ